MTDKVVFVFERSGRFNSAPVSGGVVYEGTKGEEIEIYGDHATHMQRMGYGRITGRIRQTKVEAPQETKPEPKIEAKPDRPSETEEKAERPAPRRGRQKR